MSRNVMRARLTALGIAFALLGGVVVLAQPTTEPATAPTTLPTAPGRDEGWISATVLNLDGTVMANFEIRAERMDPISMGGRGAPASKYPKEVRSTTDENGHFVLRNLQPDKRYTVVGGSDEIGWFYEEIDIVAGKEIKLGEKKMFKMP